MTTMVENPLIAWKISEWIFTREMIFMNMEVSNEELQELLNAYMKRLDKMDKERDLMITKINELNKNVKSLNKDLDDLYYQLGGDQDIQSSVNIENELSKEELDHVKKISNMIADDKIDFLDDDEFLTLIHSVVGES